jgi:hypothetical protein
LAAAVAVKPPGQDDLVVVERAAQDALDLKARLRRVQFETSGDAQLLGAGAEQVGRAAFAEQQAERAE